jgi:hypothetical protein
MLMFGALPVFQQLSTGQCLISWFLQTRGSSAGRFQGFEYRVSEDSASFWTGGNSSYVIANSKSFKAD